MVNINVHRASMTDSYENSKPYIEGACLSTDAKPTAADFAVGSIMTEADTGKVFFNSGSAWVEQFSFQD